MRALQPPQLRGVAARAPRRAAARGARAHAGAVPPTQPDGAQQEAPRAAPSRCPFALAADFMLAEPRPPKLSPLGELSVFAPPPGAPPSAHLWLAAGFSGQDTPGRLVSGLRRLTHVEEFLPQDAATQGEQLALKRRGFSERHAATFVAEPRSLPGQAECLELFLDYLPQRHPELYSVRGEGNARTITVATTGETHAVADYAARPLELCSRIVHEDLVLMRSADAPTSEPDGGDRNVMSAAAVVFSFGDMDKKLSQPVSFIHAPVPNFQAELNKLLNKTLDGLPTDKAVWRNNWALVESGRLDNPSYGTSEALSALARPMPPEQRYLKVEYQTLRRLPMSRFILFTIRTFLEPITMLSTVPGAAANLASSLRGMSQSMRAYKGLTVPQAQEEMLAYLEALATADAAAQARAR